MSQRRAASLASQGSERTNTSNTVSTSVSGLTRLVEVLGMELRRQGIPPTRADWARYFVTHHIHLLPATSSNNSIGAGSDTLSKYSSLIRRNGDGASRVLLIDLSNEGIDDRYCIALCEALVKLSNTPSYMNALWQQSHMTQYPLCWYVLLSNNALTSNATTHLSLLLQCGLPVRYVALDGNAFSAEAQQKLQQCAQAATSTEEDGSSSSGPCRVVFQVADGQAMKNTIKEVRTGVCTPRARSAETPIIVTTTQGEGVEVNKGGALRATRSYSPQHTHNSVTRTSTTASRRPLHGSMSETAAMYAVDMDALEQRRAQLFKPTQTTTQMEAESKTPQGQCASTPKDIAVHVDPHEPVTPDTTVCPHPALHKAQRVVAAAVKEEEEEEDEKGPDVTAHVSTLIDSVLDLASVTDAATGELNEAARTIHGEARTVWDILTAYTGNEASGSKEGVMANKENMRHTAHSMRETRRVNMEEEEDDAADKYKVDQDVSQLTVSASSVSGLSGGLTSFHSITVLRLNGNYLKELTVLPKSLLRLDISDNALTSLSGLAQCPMLTVLNARRNRLTAITHLEHNRFLAHLFLGRNRIKVVEGLAHMFLLETLDLSHNCIRTPSALRALSLCSALQHLLLKGNPCLTSNTNSTASGSRITSNGKGGVAGAQQRHPLYVMLRNLCPTLRKVDAYSFSGHSRYAASVDHSSDNTVIQGGEKSDASPSSVDSTTPNAMQLLRLLTRGVTSSAAGYSEAARSKAASLVHNAALKKAPAQTNKKNNTVKEEEESAVPTFRPTFIDDVTEKQTHHKAANVAAAHRSALREHVMRQLAAESQRFLQSTLTERLQPVLQEEVMHNESSEKDNAERSPAPRPTTLNHKIHKKNKEAELPRAKSHSQRHESNRSNNSVMDEDILRPYVPRPFRPPPRASRRSTTRNSCNTCEGEQDGSDALPTTPSSYAALHRAELRENNGVDNRAISKEYTVDPAAPVSYLSITLSPSPSPRRQQSATRATAAPPADYITVEEKTPCNNREYDKAGQRTGSGSRGRTSRVLLSPAPITESVPSPYANSLRERRVSSYTSNRAPQLSPPPPLPPSHRRLSPSPGQVHLGTTRTASHTTSTEPITETLPHKGTSKCTTNKEDDEECVTWVEELHASVDGVQAALRSVVQLILAQRRHSAPTTTTTTSNSGVKPNALEQRVEEQARCIVLERQRCVKLLEASGMLTDTHVPRSIVQRYGFTEAELNGEEQQDNTVTKRVMSSARLAERGDVLRQLHVLADAKTCLRYAVLLMREGREQTLQRYVDQVNDTVYNGTLSAHSA